VRLAGPIAMTRFLLVLIGTLIGLLAILPAVRSVERGRITDDVRREAPGFFVELGDGLVHVETTGPEDGPPVLLIHGLSIPSYMWDPTFQALGDAGFRAIRYDLFGGGYSDRPDVVYDEETFRRQAVDLLDALDADRAHLVGISMGGAIAASIAARHPDRILDVVLIAPFNAPPEITPLDWPLVGPWVHRVVFLPRLARRIEEGLPEGVRPPRWRERYREQMRYRGTARANLSRLRHFITRDPMPDYRALGEQERDVLLIWGMEDEVVPFHQHARVRDASGAELLALERTGHGPPLERPDAVASAMIRFLSD
jgi:pimeloyl-ACP methyl ester carboxylesterase